MKKNKFLVPLTVMTAVTGTVTPLVTLTSCSCSTKTTLCISNSGILAGFREDATDEEIEKEFGDTLVIPKDIEFIASYAFVRNGKTTIPSFIKNFRFEDGYKCKIIGQYAFAYASFEDVTITCERNQPDGEYHGQSSYFMLPDNYWGIREIHEGAFFQNKSLTSVKLPATMTNTGNFSFSCDNDGTAYTNIKTIDMSDYLMFDDSSGREQIPNNLPNMFGAYPDAGEWDGKLVLRYWDGIYGPDILGNEDKQREYVNKWRAAWGFPAISDLSQRYELGSATIKYWGETK